MPGERDEYIDDMARFIDYASLCLFVYRNLRFTIPRQPDDFSALLLLFDEMALMP